MLITSMAVLTIHMVSWQHLIAMITVISQGLFCLCCRNIGTNCSLSHGVYCVGHGLMIAIFLCNIIFYYFKSFAFLTLFLTWLYIILHHVHETAVKPL